MTDDGHLDFSFVCVGAVGEAIGHKTEEEEGLLLSFFLGGLLEISDFPGQPRENKNKAKRERAAW